MAGIPMKGDGPTMKEIVEKYGDPADSLALSYFEALAMAKETAPDAPKEAAGLMKLAERAHKMLAQYGKEPKMVDGVAKAVEA